MDTELIDDFEKKLKSAAWDPFEVIMYEHLLYHPKMEVECRVFPTLLLHTLQYVPLRLHNCARDRSLKESPKQSFGPHMSDL